MDVVSDLSSNRQIGCVFIKYIADTQRGPAAVGHLPVPEEEEVSKCAAKFI